MQFIITGENVIIISGETAELRRRRVFLPLPIRPWSFVDLVPLLADTKIKVAIKPPIAIPLFANLTSRIRALWTQLISRPHFEICRDERFC